MSQPAVPQRPDEREQRAREDLAAAYRMCGIYGWTNLIYSHISLRLPGDPGHFLFKPHELMFEEVTASSLLKMTLDGEVIEPQGASTNPGYTFHASILKARPDLNCVLHVHSNAGMAISALSGELLPLTQDAMHFYRRMSYHAYEGLSQAGTSRNQLVDDLGENRAMILRNHGLVTCGGNVAQAVVLMKYLVDCCATQLMVQASGVPVSLPSDEAAEKAAAQWDRYYASNPELKDEWGALVRMVDRLNPGHRE